MAIGAPLTGGEGDELLTFAPLEDENGLEIVDHIERRHLQIDTTNPISPIPVSTDRFEFPVDKGIQIKTRELFVPYPKIVCVRNSLGIQIAEMVQDDAETFPEDRYGLQISAPIKLYVVFESACSITTSADGVNIDLGTTATVHIGARSHHKQPAANITISDDPEDLMTAVSYFGSALKTTSCERSYPTLRGHPPTVEVADELRIPSELTRPDTDITIILPADYAHVFTVATLAYYLGANVETGTPPRIVTGNGFEQPIGDGPETVQEDVERILKQVFFLDCLTRTEGLYPFNLYERNQIGDDLGLDFVDLYEEPVHVQLESYLDVPFGSIEPYLPRWKQTAEITPRAEYAETLPYVANDLAVIRPVEDKSPGRPHTYSTEVGEFFRGGSASTDVRTVAESAPSPSLIRVDDANSLEQTWFGNGAPIGASKGMVQAYKNRLKRPPSDGDIDITVVCNSSDMAEEQTLVDEIYGSRQELPFDVSIHWEVTTSDLERIITEDTEFLHYIGHIDAGGFECIDGRLDVSSIDRSGIDVFFLNACTSYQQGIELIRKGSIAGVVTLEDVINSGAERVGFTLARLLNQGFPLQSALELAKSRSIMGGHYLVIGDGSLDITQPKSRFAALCDIEKRGEKWALNYVSYPGRSNGMGSIIYPFVENNDEYYLSSGSSGHFVLTDEELDEFLGLETEPVKFDGDLFWSDEFDTNREG